MNITTNLAHCVNSKLNHAANASHPIDRQTGDLKLFKKLAFLGIFLFMTYGNYSYGQCPGPEVIFTEDFEDHGNTANGGAGRYSSPNDFHEGTAGADDDYWGRIEGSTMLYYLTNTSSGFPISTNTSYAGWNGSFFYAGEDMDDLNGSIGSPDGSDIKEISFTGINITGATSMCFSGLFARGENDACTLSTYDQDDYIKVYYTIDGGSEVEALCFNADLECNIPGDFFNEPLHHDPDCDGDGGEGSVLTNTLTEYTFNIMGTGSVLDIRVEVHMDAGDEEIALDFLRVHSATPVVACTTTVSMTAPADLCENAGVQTGLSGGLPVPGAGETGVYSGPGVTDDGNGMTYSFDPAAAGVGVHTITYTFNDGVDCIDVTAMDDVEVFASSVSFTAPADLCVDAGVQTGLGGGTPTGGVYSGPGVTDDGNGMTYSFDPAAAGSGVQTLTYTVGSGVCNSANDDVEVYALPTVTLMTPDTVCIDGGVMTFNGGMPTGGTYSGSGVTDNSNGMDYDFDPIAAGLGTHTVTYNYTDGNGCSGSAMDDILVSAPTSVSLTIPPGLDTLCIDAGIQNIANAGSPAGGVYSGPGVTDDGNGMSFTFDPQAAGSGFHQITYTVGGSCGGFFIDFIQVFDLPIVTFSIPADQDSFCIDAGVQLITISGAPSGGVYSGPGVTDSGDGLSFTFDPVGAGVGFHVLTYTYTDGNGCSNSFNDFIVVFGLPTVTFTAPADLCLDAGVQAGLGGGTPVGGVYSGPGVTDDANGMTYSFDPAAAGVGVHTITYTYTDVEGCESSASDDVEVFALPTVTFTAPADLCVDAGVQAGLGGGTPTGGVYSGPGVTDDGNGMTYSFDPAAAGVGTHTITYDFTDTNGCSGSASDDVEVFALPTVTFTAPADLCIDAGVQTGLTGGTPPQGTEAGDMGVYSGPGVTDDGNGMTYSFDPAAAGVGVHTIIYSYTDGSGCSASAMDDVEVFALPTVTFTAPADLCVDAGVQAGLGGGTPPQGSVAGDMGVYSGPGVSDDGNGMTYSFDPAAAGVGVHTLTYTYTDENGCSASAMDDVEVFALPTVTFTAPADLCVDAGVQAGLGGGTPTGGVYSGPGVTDDGNGMTYSFDPAAAGVGTHTITYDYTDTNGCSGSASDDVEVFALPTVTFTAPADLCVDAGVQVGLGGGTPTGGVYSGPGVTDNGNGTDYDFDPAAAGVGVHTLTYTYTDANGCTNSASDDVEVFALPTVTFTAPADLCVDAGVQAGLGGGTPTGGVYSGPGVTDNGNGTDYDFDPAAAGVGVHTITYTYTDANGCTNSASDDVEVFALPTVTFTALADLCIDAGVQTGLGSGTPTGGVYSGTGVTDDGNGMTYSFDPAAAGVGTHTITYTYTDGNGCTNSASDDVEVFALPAVTFTALADLCIDAGVQAGLGGGTPTGGVYSGPGVTDDGNGMTYSFDPAAAGVGLHTITYTYTDVNGCTNSASDDVEVFALPTVTFTAPADLCIDAGVQAGLSGGTPAGGGSGGISGMLYGATNNGEYFSIDPSTGVATIIDPSFIPVTSMGFDPISGIAFGQEVNGAGTGFEFDILTGVITDPPTLNIGTPEWFQGASVYNGTWYTLGVNGAPLRTFDPVTQVLTLIGPTGLDLSSLAIDPATGIAYAATGQGVTELYTIDLLTGTPTLLANTGVVIGGLEFHNGVLYGGGAQGNSGEVYTIDPSTGVATLIGASGLISPITSIISGSSPSSTMGIYSGPGVTDDGNGMTYSFDPAIAGVGVHTITYTYTDANGCTNSASDDVEVFALPAVTFTALADLCIDAGIQTGQGSGTPTGGVYSGTGVTDDGNGMTYSFDPAVAGVGTHTITYLFTDANGCSSTASDDVEVFDLPTVTFTALADLCLNDGVQAGLGGGTPTGGVYSGPGVTDDGNGMTYSFDPAAAGVGVHTLTYTYTDTNGCTDSASDDVEVFELPVVTFTAPMNVCVDAGVQTGLGIGDLVAVYPYDNSASDPGLRIIDPSTLLETNAIEITSPTLTVTGANGIARHPMTGVYYAIVKVSGQSARSLVTIDIATGVATEIGSTGLRLSGLAFTDTGVLYAISGDGASPSETLYTLDLATGTPTFVLTLGNGSDGEAIVFNPEDGLLYHLSGRDTDFAYESIDLNTLVVTNIPISGYPTDEVHGVSYLGSNTFLLSNLDEEWVTITTGGFATLIGAQDDYYRGHVNASDASPAGGVFSGPGVTDDGNGMTYSFDPAVAGVGVHTITYTYTDGNGCTNSASDDVEVFDLPSVSFSAPDDLCIDAGVQTGLSSGVPAGGVYSGPGVTDDGNGMTYSFDPAAAGVGVHTITYDYSDTNGCMGSFSDDVEVFDLPTVSLATAPGYCLDAPIQGAPITGGSPAGGVYSGIGVTDLGNGISYNFDPTVNGPGIVTITYTYTDANGCTNSAMSDLEVYDCDLGNDFTPGDPCSCLDNATIIDLDAGTGGEDGQFSEIVTVSNATGAPLPPGQTWSIVGGGDGFDAFNVPPVGVQSAGVPIPTDGSVLLAYNAVTGVYEIPFVHVENLGYFFTIEGPFPMGSAANVTLNIDNECYYPEPVFDPAIPDMININDPIIPLAGTDTNGGTSDSETFTIDGSPATELDPSMLALGLHTVVMTYDGADDGQGGISGATPASPGCIQEVQKTFEIIDCELDVDCSNIVDITLSCRADLPPVDFNLPIINDSCGEVTTSALTIIPGDSGCPGDTLFITRTYFLQDENGNMAECMQTFTVISTMDPVFTFFPADTMVLCGEDTDPSATGMAMGEGECHPAGPQATVSFVDATATGACPTEMVITRTWTVTDRCGRTTSQDQVIMVIDTVAPTFDQMPLPADATVECSEIPDPEVLTATDNCGASALSLMISEIHYDNSGTDVGEFIEVAGTAGTDLSNCELVLYNGSNSMTYNMMSLSGVIDDEGTGYGAVSFSYPTNGLQNGAPDGVALVCNGQVIEFISYEGVITAVGGPADGMTSVNIGAESSATPIGESLQLEGTGCSLGSFTWATATMPESPGTINAGMTFDSGLCPVDNAATVTFSEVFTPGNTCPQEGDLVRTWVADDGCGNTTTHVQTLTVIDTQGPVICDAPADTIIDCDAIVPPAPVVTAFDLCDNFGGDVWINEFHYDNSGTDVGEFIEIAGSFGTDLSEYTLELYNGSNGTLFSTLMLTGEIPNEGCGFGALSFATPGLMNGSPDGMALVNNGTVIQFLSYEGSFTATNGTAMGMSSVDVGVSESSSTPAGQSLQLTGTGSTYSDFAWSGPSTESPGALNAGQTLQASIIASLVETSAPGSCPQEMIITRTWSAMDACGNMAPDVVQTIMIQDTTAPTVVCQDITIYLDENGEGTLAPEDVVTSSGDNCSDIDDLVYTVSRSDFNCMDIIPNTLPGCENSFDLNVMVEDECGNIGTCLFVATVQDTLAPVLTCPDDLIISLDAGECGQIYNFVPPFAVDNCEGMLQTTFLGTTFIDNNGFAGNMFDVENIGAAPLTITMFDIHFESAAGTPHTAEVWYTTTDDTYVGNETDASAWTSLGSSAAIAAGPGQPTPLAVGGLTLAPGQRIGLYVAQTDGGSNIDYTNGANNYTDANLSITTGVGKGLPTFTGGTFNPRTWNGNIHYTFLTGNISMVNQTAGTDLMSGDFFEDGFYFWTYEADDGCGNVSECTFSLDIRPFPLEDVTTSLNCNNMVNVSLSNDCEACLNADMILEGGPYTCYDDYLVSSTNGAGMVVDASFGSGTYLCLGPDDIGKIIQVQVTDPLTGNSCWGNVRVEDKLPPVIECPERDTIKCFEYGNVSITDPVVTDCSDFELFFTDAASGDDCEGRLITRSYVAIDENGLTSTCEVIIQVDPLDSQEDIIDPAGLVQLTCGSGTDPQSIAAYFDDPSTANNEGYKYAYPTYVIGSDTFKVDPSVCDFNASYKDHEIDACGSNCHGNKKIIRTWTYLDWCEPTNYREVTQLINAKDVEGPTFITKDTMVSTRPWDCTGEFMLPEPWELHDNCDINPYYTVSGPPGVTITAKPGGGWIASGAPKGVHEFNYTAWDCCGNSTTHPVMIAVLDYIAPVVTTKRDIVVSLTPGGLVDTSALAKLYCPSVDNGSYDFCSDVYCEIRRPMGSPVCDNIGINGHNNNMTFNNTDVKFLSGNHPDDNRNDTDGGEYVKFCCDDITRIEGDANEDGMVDSLDAGYVKVIIRVWDDANMSGVYGDEAVPFVGLAAQKDNYNEGWAWVKVECKSIPVIACPPADTVKCYWDVKFDPAAGWRKVSEVDLSKSGYATAFGCCGPVDVEFSDAGNLQECQEGTFVRTFRAGYIGIDGQQQYVQCQQRITVLRDEYVVTVTPKNRDFANPSCTFDESIIDQARPTINGGPCDVIGENVTVDTFLFENGVCKKWRITYEYWNWCKQEAYGPFTEYAIYEDTDDPVIMTCQDTCISVDANCEAVVTLTNAAYDISECTDDEWIKWVVEIDLWADGTIDAVAATHYTQRNWTSVVDPWYGAIQVINLPGTASKDSVNQPMDQLSDDQIATITFPEVLDGKMSNHKISWKAIDGCHNEAGCSYNVMVTDKKAPTPYCVSLSSAIMEDGTVELWAKDFDRGSFDNCTDDEDLWFTFNEMAGAFKDTIITFGGRDYLVNADIPQFFDEDGFVGFDGDGVVTDANGNIIPAATNANLVAYGNGDIQRWRPDYNSSAKIFDCDEFDVQGPNGVPVRMTVWDKKCNYDFCLVFLSLIDNQGGCDPNAPRVSGTIITDNGSPLEQTVVTIEGDVNDITKVTVGNGAYEFQVPAGVNYEVSAEKDVDYMNGVSTLDLVLIQRHILGLAELDTEYKWISADVNNDMQIRANDLVELRKLILGITNDFTATSWKLVDAKEAIEMSTPLQYSEIVSVPNLQTDVTDADFIATKVGDVSGDAQSNARGEVVENRNRGTVHLIVEDQEVVAGQPVDVAVTSSNFTAVYGYQFTSGLNGLALTGVRSGAIEMNDNHVGLPSLDMMTASWASDEMVSAIDGEVLFTIEFVATKSGKLSEMLTLNSAITRAESYTGEGMEVGSIDLTFRTETSTADVLRNALYQNEPNPFKGMTKIGYELVEAGEATFTMYDVTGKVLYTKTVEAERGMNTLEISSDELGVSGIVYYQIESGDFVATKKMIVLK